MGGGEASIAGYTPIYIIETYCSDDGTDWYRKWSDGWIEQGGKKSIPKCGTTVSFLQPFNGVTYTISAIVLDSNMESKLYTAKCNRPSGESAYITTSYQYGSDTQWIATAVSWYACGY